jgi:hypothetical protein
MHIDSSLAEQLLRLEQTLLSPEVRTSFEEFSSLLADDFIEFGSSGRVYDKQHIIDALQYQPETSFSLDGFQARLLAPGVALTTYRINRTTALENEPRYSLHSSIWKHEDGRWQITFHQGTWVQPLDQ